MNQWYGQTRAAGKIRNLSNVLIVRVTFPLMHWTDNEQSGVADVADARARPSARGSICDLKLYR